MIWAVLPLIFWELGLVVGMTLHYEWYCIQEIVIFKRFTVVVKKGYLGGKADSNILVDKTCVHPKSSKLIFEFGFVYMCNFNHKRNYLL